MFVLTFTIKCLQYSICSELKTPCDNNLFQTLVLFKRLETLDPVIVLLF